MFSRQDEAQEHLLRTLLGSTEQGAVLLERKVNLDESSTLEKLDDHAGRDDGGDTQLHQGTAVRGEDDTHPVQRVCAETMSASSADSD